MPRFSAIFVFAIFAAGDDGARTPLKKYTINLDLAPEDRFVEVAKAHASYIKAVLQILSLKFRSHSVTQVLNAAVLDEEHRRELQGMADVIGITWEQALMANYFYELSAVTEDENLPEWRDVSKRSCTGIVAQSSNGTVMMSRNQDYPPLFSPLQYDGIFVKGGRVAFEATSFAGNIGVGGTCMVPGNFSAEINARGASRPSLVEITKSAAAGNPSFPLLLRQGCERGGDFESAVNYFSGTPLILGGYVTVAGAAPGEGAIVTRNATVEGTDVLRLTAGYPAEAPWFLVQTNYDHWTAPPKFDDRRDSAICLMEAIGPAHVDLEALWDVMPDEGKGNCSSSRGVYNAETIHTELVLPATGEYHTYLRHGPEVDSLNILEAGVRHGFEHASAALPFFAVIV